MAKANVELSELIIVGGIAVGATLIWDHTSNNGNVLTLLKNSFSEVAKVLFGDDEKTKVDDSNDQKNDTTPKRNSSNQVSDEAPQTDDQHGDGGSSKLDERVHAPSKSKMTEEKPQEKPEVN